MINPPDAEILRVFAAALRQAREEEIERIRFHVGMLEFLRDETLLWLADLRQLRAAWSEPWTAQRQRAVFPEK
jgi:hypothetical protein